MREPSGEYCGLESYCVDAISWVAWSGAERSSLQIFASFTNWLKANCRPSRENAGSETFTPVVENRSGLPPEAFTSQNAACPPRSDEKTIDRPSGVHARPTMKRLSKVTR